jgi:predicted DNA-binding antitoxin AbrB/MazE fold protein
LILNKEVSILEEESLFSKRGKIMYQTIEAVYQDGVLTPIEKVDIPNGTRALVTFLSRKEQNTQELASAYKEYAALAQSMAEEGMDEYEQLIQHTE